MRFLILALLLSCPLHLFASQQEAQRILRTYELSSEAWKLKLNLAESTKEKQELWKKRPDRIATASTIFKEINGALNQDWSIPYSAFFLNLTRGLTITSDNGTNPFAAQRQKIIVNFQKHHLNKPGIGPFAIALADSGDPRALTILEKISKENPEEASQGIAALAASIILKNLGDAPELMKKRLNHLRSAIIKASDQKIGEMTVADIAGDELYIIRFLSKGRIAPNFSGADVASRIVNLTDSRNKVTVLIFWDAKSAETDKLIELTNRLSKKVAGKPVKILGVTPESLSRIRELQADGSIQWNNIIDRTEKIATQYRITQRPFVFILDKKGVIQYAGAPGSFVDLTVDALLSE